MSRAYLLRRRVLRSSRPRGPHLVPAIGFAHAPRGQARILTPSKNSREPLYGDDAGIRKPKSSIHFSLVIPIKFKFPCKFMRLECQLIYGNDELGILFFKKISERVFFWCVLSFEFFLDSEITQCPISRLFPGLQQRREYTSLGKPRANPESIRKY